MSSLLQADIFFFITTIAVIVLLIIATVIGYFIFKLVRHAEYIAKKIRDESDNLSDDIAYLRANIRDKVERTSFGIGGILRFVTGLFKSQGQSGSRTSSKGRTKSAKASKVVSGDEQEVE